MQKRTSHTKILSEMPSGNNYYVMPKSIRATPQPRLNDPSNRKTTSSNDLHEHLNHPELFQNSYQHNTCCQTNIECQQALRYSEFNYQQLQRSYSQLQQNYLDMQTMYSQSELKNKQLQNELRMIQSTFQLKENETQSVQEINLQYVKEIATLKVQIQKQNSIIQKLTEEIKQIKDVNLNTNPSFLFEKGSVSQRDNRLLNDLNDSIISQTPKNNNLSFNNQQLSQQQQIENVTIYQNKIIQFQKDLADKNALISGLQQQVKNLTEFQGQLMQKSPQKKIHLKGFKKPDDPSPMETPIPKLLIPNETQNMSNKNLFKFMDEQGKSEYGIQKTRQSDEIDINPSARSTITTTKSKQELQQIYKKINQSTLYTAGLYSSLLDYQYLANNAQQHNKLLSASNSKDYLHN